MKKLTATTLTSFLLLANSSMLCASTNGIYAGVGVGTSTIDMKEYHLMPVKNDGISARVYGGYRFNEYFGLETSYTQFNKENYALVDYPWVTFDYKLSAISLFGKLYLPLNERFNINISFGGAQMSSDIDATSTYNSSAHYLESTNGLVFGGGIGAEFLLTQHLAANVDFIGFDEKEDNYSNLPVPASRLLTVGLTYLF